MRAQEKANDLGFPNGQGEQVEFLQGLELRALDQASQHGEEDPLLLVFGFTPHPGPLGPPSALASSGCFPKEEKATHVLL